MPKSSPPGRPGLAERPDDTALPTLRLRGPADLVYAVPYLIGFHPHDSLVLVGLDRSRLVVTARLDLADTTVGGVLAHTLAAIRRGGAIEVVALVVSAAPRGGRAAAWQAELTALARAADEADCDLLDVLLVSGQRWWSLLCADTGCCPPEGTPLESPEGTEVAATATYAGLVALPDRSALAASLQPRPAAERAALLAALAAAVTAAGESRAAADTARRSVTRALFAAARSGSPPTESDRVRFGAALRDLAVRDSVWVAVDDGRLDGRELWLALATTLPAPYDAAPMFLFGWASWRHGNGALAGMAAERAVESDPGYSAADLLLAAVRGGIDPRRLPRLRPRRSA